MKNDLSGSSSQADSNLDAKPVRGRLAGLAAMVLLGLHGMPAVALPIPQAFTYQGELWDAGAPKNGTVDLVFRIFDAEQNGFLYDTIFKNDVPVQQGLFTVQLLSNNIAFDEGGNYWLAVEVRDGALDNPAPYTLLTPRQPISSMPFAINSDKVDGLDAAQMKLSRLGVTFSVSGIPAQGQTPAEASVLSFSAPVAGKIVASARGYCNLQGGDFDNLVNLGIGSTATDAFPPNQFAQLGIVSTPFGAVGGNHQLSFTAEKTRVVAAGENVVLHLYARHELGSANAGCSGTYSLEFWPD